MNKVCMRCPASAGCKLVQGSPACRKSAARFDYIPRARQIDRIQAMGAESLACFIENLLENPDEISAMLCENHCSAHRADGNCPSETQKEYCHKAVINWLLSYVGEKSV